MVEGAVGGFVEFLRVGGFVGGCRVGGWRVWGYFEHIQILILAGHRFPTKGSGGSCAQVSRPGIWETGAPESALRTATIKLRRDLTV